MVKEFDVWDQDLSSREVELLNPKFKSLRSRTSLERKVSCLEKWATNRRLCQRYESDIPWKRPALRKWHNAEMLLWSWQFSPVDDPVGKNKDLMERYAVALSTIKKMLGSGTDAENEALKTRVVALEKQNVALLDQVLQLQRMIPKPSQKR